MKNLLKQVAYSVLNESAQRWLKKRYFAYQYSRDAIWEQEMRFLNRFINPGDAVLDIGANVGLYTVKLSRLVGPAGTVHAFEPVPETFDILQHVTRSLGLENVVLHNCALADCEGDLKVVVPTDSTGVKNYYLAHLKLDKPGSGEGVMIRAQTIDAMRENGLPKVSFIKCDVEGAELLVLRGARSVLQSDRPILLCEVCEHHKGFKTSAHETFMYFHKLGFQGFRADGNSLTRCDGPRSDTVNYFFLPVERVVTTVGPTDRAGELPPGQKPSQLGTFKCAPADVGQRDLWYF